MGDDGYAADGEAEDGGGDISPGAAPHLVVRVPTAGSKRRAPSVTTLEALNANGGGSGGGVRERDVDCIAERLARIQASPPKRCKSTGLTPGGASRRGGTPTGDSTVGTSPLLRWPPSAARDAETDMQL